MAGTSPDAKAIFAEALGKTTPQEQTAYVDTACGGDPQLRVEVQSLLAAHHKAGPFLRVLLEDQQAPSGDLLTEGPGTAIGRYKLLEKIGEGGMAVVYMAEQTEPIRRKVALKIIKLGMDTRQVIARFEAERQALALMDHPSIAKVLDAGATETGRPYFVMELVQGVSITEYCDKNSLGTKDRLRLFLQVCHAVQHAHTKGIIHRDIKPSNVLVTHHDGKPVPKVIDFGIAKAMVRATHASPLLTEKTFFTRYGHIIGIPAYMSPEQAELSDLDIDTRSDIYSLGVLLYELLTGTTPFSEEELRKAGYLEMQRVIREQEPVKPSTRIKTALRTAPRRDAPLRVRPARRGKGILPLRVAGILPAIRGRPRTEGPLRVRLDTKSTGETPVVLMGGTPMLREVRGDLDWIVMKSLEKDRLQRYEAAAALALNIQRHLANRPVLARAPSPGYRLRKFLRRHRVQALAVLAFAGVATVLMVVLAAWNRERAQFAQAETLRQKDILSHARVQWEKQDYAAALEMIRPILGKKYVGPAARRLQEQILNELRERVNQCTRRIEADPMDARVYSERAHYYDVLHDRPSALADMARWSTIQRQRAFRDFWLGVARDSERVIAGPSDYHLLFSVEKQERGIPVLYVAFGQKGRWEIRMFEIPVLVTSLLGFCLMSGLEPPAARADFTFGEPVDLETVMPVTDGANDVVDCLSYDGLEMYIHSMWPGARRQMIPGASQ